MELDNHPHLPEITISMKIISFTLGFVAFIPSVDLTIRVCSLIGMAAGLWLTAVIHEDKVNAKLRGYKRFVQAFIDNFRKLF